jgi:hypothetical protein
VHWYEYHDVQRASDMIVREKAPSDNEEVTLRKAFEQRGVEYKNAIIRRSIASAMLPT